MRASSCLVLVSLFSAGFALSGCSSGRLPELSQNKWSSAPRWPLAPEPARVIRVGEISSSEDIVASRSLVRLVAGDTTLRLDRPMDVAIDSRQRVLVADAGLRRIVIFDTASGETKTIGSFGRRRLMSPVGVAATEAGWCASDSALAAVACFDGDDEELFVIAQGLARPTGITYQPATKTLWVVDTLGHRLVAFDGKGRQIRSVGSKGAAPGSFNYPLDCAVGQDGSLWVVDGLNFRVQRFSPEGKVISNFGGPGDSSGSFARPKGIATGPGGTIMVTDALFDNVQLFDGTGRLLLVFGQRGSGQAGLLLPAGITVDEKARVFVADSGNHRIQIFRLLSEQGGLQ